MARKVIVEIELPEGARLEDILRGVKYRIVEDRVERLEKLFERINEKAVKVDRIPTREEIYADRVGH